MKVDLILKVYASLMQDVLPSRANNLANDQDSVQEFLNWCEQNSVEFVTKKAIFSMFAFDQVTPPFSLCLHTSFHLLLKKAVGLF